MTIIILLKKIKISFQDVLNDTLNNLLMCDITHKNYYERLIFEGSRSVVFSLSAHYHDRVITAHIGLS